MNNLKIVKLQKMEKHELEKLIREQILCRIAFNDNDYPYIAPFQYAYINGFLYFHLTDYGKKIALIEKDNRVCIEIEKYLPDLSEYYFIVLRGKLKTVEDPYERDNAIKMMAKQGKEKLSRNFLAAHGFRKEVGWSSFTSKKPILIYKLDEIRHKAGLKSP